MPDTEPKPAIGNPHPRNTPGGQAEEVPVDPEKTVDSGPMPSNPNQPDMGNPHPRNTP